MKKILSKILAATLSLTAMLSVIGLFSACSAGPETLKDAYKDYFKIGAAVALPTQDNELQYDDEILSEFNSFTAENEMKWAYTESPRGNYTWQKGDALIEHAKRLDAGVRGHALVWHESMPDYIFTNLSSDPDVAKEQVLEDVRSHVTETVKHYGNDVVYCWDVVNEAISDSGDPKHVYRDGSEGSKYYQWTGEEYIFEAFRAARAADPDMKLYYNDYSLINPVKREKAMSLVKKLQEEDLIDGIGEQGHYSIREFDPVAFREMLEDFSTLGLEVSITELDLSVYSKSGSVVEEEINPLSDELAALQAEAYKSIFEICREYGDMIDSVTLWGVADDNTWLSNSNTAGGGQTVGKRQDHPLLFDIWREEKPAYYAVRDWAQNDKFVYDEEKENDARFSVYDGTGNEFHFGGKWYPVEANSGLEANNAYKMQDGTTVTELYYTKLKTYSAFASKVHGPLDKFNYVNFTLSSDRDMLLMAQLNYTTTKTPTEQTDHLTGEESFEVGMQKQTYTIRIPDSRDCYLNLFEDVWLFPEAGETGADFTGSLFVHDAWFSTEAPEGAKVMEPGVSGGVQERAYRRNGQSTWYNETSWTKYTLKLPQDSSDGLIQISASGAASWGFVSVQLDEFDVQDTKLVFKYIDNSSEGNSVEYIRFRLRGAPIEMVNDGINTYMTYHDKDLPDWIYNESTVSKDPVTGEVTIELDISDEVKYLREQDGAIDLSEDGYGLRLVMLIESVGAEFAPAVKADGRFDITVTAVYTK